MKFIPSIMLFVLFSINVLSQNNIVNTNNNLKVKICTRLNNQDIVYRGITNPILIEVSENLKYIATGEGLVKVDDLGNYKLYPKTGKEVTIKVKVSNSEGEKFEVSKTFKIKNLSSGVSQFNGKSCKKCELKLLKKELINGRISYDFPDLLVDSLKIEVVSFKIKVMDKSIREVKGNRIKSSMLIKDIQNAKRESLVQIFDIRIQYNFPYNSGIRICKINPIEIRLID